MIAAFGARMPAIDPSAYVVDSAVVIGDVTLAPDVSIWFHTVLRADVERIRIGARTNIQDSATVHVTRDRWPTLVGEGVTVGHAAVLHGCTVGDHCLVGIGAILLDGVVLEPECLVGAGALITPGTHVSARSLVLGQPARRIRELTVEEIERIHRSAEGYVERAQAYRAQGLR